MGRSQDCDPKLAIGTPRSLDRYSAIGRAFFANEIVVARNRQTTTFDLSSGLIFGDDAE
jgi:hypothetical protein